MYFHIFCSLATFAVSNIRIRKILFSNLSGARHKKQFSCCVYSTKKWCALEQSVFGMAMECSYDRCWNFPLCVCVYFVSRIVKIHVRMYNNWENGKSYTDRNKQTKRYFTAPTYVSNSLYAVDIGRTKLVWSAFELEISTISKQFYCFFFLSTNNLNIRPILWVCHSQTPMNRLCMDDGKCVMQI